mgnify:CR=1 FL=1
MQFKKKEGVSKKILKNKKEELSIMVKYVLLNINSILNNVRNNLTDIFFCCYKIKNIVMTKEQYSVND